MRRGEEDKGRLEREKVVRRLRWKAIRSERKRKKEES